MPPRVPCRDVSGAQTGGDRHHLGDGPALLGQAEQRGPDLAGERVVGRQGLIGALDDRDRGGEPQCTDELRGGNGRKAVTATTPTLRPAARSWSTTPMAVSPIVPMATRIVSASSVRWVAMGA